MTRNEIQAEISLLESTDSPFPEVRERRIEVLKVELKEARDNESTGEELEESKKQYKIGPYKEQRFAQDESEVFKPQGVKSIQITKEPGGWFISFSSDKKLFSDRMYWAIINGIEGGSQWSRKDISWALNNRGRSSSDSPAAKEIRERYKELSRMEMLKIGYVAPKHQ